jgi:hypothetical protein
MWKHFNMLLEEQEKEEESDEEYKTNKSSI